MKIIVEKPTREFLDKNRVEAWPIWEKGVSEFEWFYSEREQCYLLEGEVAVTDRVGQTTQFGKGDFVTFPRGLSCVWKVISPVKKHYNFG